MFVPRDAAGINRCGKSSHNFVCSGFSLLEVLVAGTVFSLGLAGLAALLLASISGSAQSRREGVASMAAASLAEQIRMNPGALDRFLNPPEYVARICTGDDRCTPGQQADYDFKLWQLELADSIRNATGMVCHDATPQDGENGDSRCDGSGPLVIKIFWSGPGKEGSRHRFTLEVS